MTLHSLPVNLIHFKYNLDAMKTFPSIHNYWYFTKVDIMDLEDNLYYALRAIQYALRGLLLK